MLASELKYHVFEDYGINFDEKNNNFSTVRLAQWYKEGQEPDRSKAKLEIRQIILKPEGEIVGKGYTFKTPEGPNELTIGLLSIGYGKTKDVIKTICTRKDFKESVEHLNDDPDEESSNGEMFDMRSLLLGIDVDNEKDEDEEE